MHPPAPPGAAHPAISAMDTADHVPSVSISAAYQCPSLLPISATSSVPAQCRLSVPISAAYPCHLISAAYQCPSVQPHQCTSGKEKKLPVCKIV
ncbi:unnamed protein product [Staurois parvus]|uniref:Uncharacterized protein n=1 Tax=Staurois parvus TaxID=386267 RepID=A0ABN9G0M6_9NEOB|nr:unnamed protein product [Staurois parvus]